MLTPSQKILSALVYKNNAISHAKMTVTTATALSSIPDNCTYALITVEAATSSDGIRFWLDGTTPTSTDGMLRGDGSAMDIDGAQNVRNFKCIGIGAGAILQVQYFQ